MAAFKEWLNENQPGFLTKAMRWAKGESLPKDMQPGDIETYNALRSTGVGHEEALKTTYKGNGSPLASRVAGAMQMGKHKMDPHQQQDFERKNYRTY